MSKIKILPEHLANQIAAGEVIERPASVVKEFVENAIDAGARQVTVEVEGNGTRLIRIVDDGEGMDQDDVLLALERHATSKLTREEQLAAIRTLGFRGEAVPSIASVSQLTITSRRAEAALGTRAEVRYGKVQKVHDMGCGRGTSLEVRDLFGNVPARRKFLKTAQTELSHIEGVVKNYALAYPALGLRYAVSGRDILNLPAEADNLEQRVRRLLGRQCESPLVALSAGDEALGVRGFLLPPEQAAGAGARLALFVNGRAVRDRLLVHAVSEGLRNFLMKGRGPAGALYLSIAPEAVDVNVHPTKQEVRFRQAPQVHRLVTAAVEQAMAAYQQELKGEVFSQPVSRPTAERNPRPRGDRSEWTQPALPAARSCEPEAESVDVPPPQSALDTSRPRRGDAEESGSSQLSSAPAVEPPAPAEILERDQKNQPAAPSPPAAFRFVGQVFSSYLLCESDKGLVVVDQHAAHERLLFEALQEQLRTRPLARQSLLFPQMLELGPEELELIHKHGAEMAQLGLELQEFGGGSFVLKAVPALLSHMEPGELVRDLLEQYAACEQGGRRSEGSRLDHLLATMACKAAVKGGQPLQPEECEGLLRQIRDSNTFSHCPHGRPVMKFFSDHDMKKWFHRT